MDLLEQFSFLQHPGAPGALVGAAWFGRELSSFILKWRKQEKTLELTYSPQAEWKKYCEVQFKNLGDNDSRLFSLLSDMKGCLNRLETEMVTVRKDAAAARTGKGKTNGRN